VSAGELVVQPLPGAHRQVQHHNTAAITKRSTGTYVSFVCNFQRGAGFPMVAIDAMDAMREGHDGSGVGLFLRDLSGPFDYMKDAPILSGIFTKQGLRRLDDIMMDIGFRTKYKISIKVPQEPPAGIPKRDIYLIRAYEYPEEWEGWTEAQRYLGLVETRLKLRALGERNRI
jgi:hypothetical protein